MVNSLCSFVSQKTGNGVVEYTLHILAQEIGTRNTKISGIKNKAKKNIKESLNTTHNIGDRKTIKSR